METKPYQIDFKVYENEIVFIDKNGKRVGGILMPGFPEKFFNKILNSYSECTLPTSNPQVRMEIDNAI